MFRKIDLAVILMALNQIKKELNQRVARNFFLREQTDDLVFGQILRDLLRKVHLHFYALVLDIGHLTDYFLLPKILNIFLCIFQVVFKGGETMVLPLCF